MYQLYLLGYDMVTIAIQKYSTLELIEFTFTVHRFTRSLLKIAPGHWLYYFPLASTTTLQRAKAIRYRSLWSDPVASPHQ